MEKIKTDSEIIIVKFIAHGGTVFEAYEPSIGGYASESHSSLFRIGDVVCGKVATRRITAELAAMKPGSDERYSAVKAYHDANKRIAYDAIRAACPEARDGHEDGMGAIELARCTKCGRP